MEVKTWKTDHVGSLLACLFLSIKFFFFFYFHFFLLVSLPTVICVLLMFFWFFLIIVDVSARHQMQGGGGGCLTSKGHRSPHFPVVWWDPLSASKWKLCLNLSEEVHFYWCCWLFLLYKQHKCENLGASIRSRLTARWRCPPHRAEKASEAFLVLDVQSC